MAHHADSPDNALKCLFLSPREFSWGSGLSLATIHRYLKRGLLPSRQPAGKRGRILIPISALESIPGLSATGNFNGSTPVPSPESPSSTLSGRRPRWARRLDTIQNEETEQLCPPEGRKNG
jgi:hypothetical protein